MSNTSAASRNELLSTAVRTGLYSLVICTFLVLAFALVIKLFSIDPSIIPLVNQVIKIASVAIGALLCVRGDKGLLKGALGGLLFALLSTALFAVLGGKFALPDILLNTLTALITGGIAGLIAARKLR